MLAHKSSKAVVRNEKSRVDVDREDQRSFNYGRSMTPDELTELRAQRNSARRELHEAEMSRLRAEIEKDRAATRAISKKPNSAPKPTTASKRPRLVKAKSKAPSLSNTIVTRPVRKNREPPTDYIDIDDSESEPSAEEDPPESWYSEIPLERAAARYLWAGLASKTRGLYETGRRSYKDYCQKAVSTAAYPITVAKLAGWLAHLGDCGLDPKTIKGYLAAVRSSQLDIGFDDSEIFHAPLLSCIIAGIKQKNNKNSNSKVPEKMPITRDLLLALVKGLNQANRAHATLHAAYCLAFAAFLRVGEITHTPTDLQDSNFGTWHLTRRSIQLESDKLYLSLPSSKTDPFRRGITLTVAASGDAACAVASLQNLFTKFPMPPEASLFQTYTNGGGFARQYLTLALRSGLKNLGIVVTADSSGGGGGGYSFRQGAATAAKEVGLSDDEIQVLGRWKVDSYRLYLQMHQSHILNASTRIQRGAPAIPADYTDPIESPDSQQGQQDKQQEQQKQLGLMSPP